MSAELNLVKLEGNESWPIIVGVKSITGERLPGESRILKLDDKSGSGFGFGGGDGGGGGGGGFEFEAGQHQGLLLSGETMVGGPSFRVGYPGEYSVVVAVAEDEIVVSRYLRRLGLVGWVWGLSLVLVVVVEVAAAMKCRCVLGFFCLFVYGIGRQRQSV